MNDNALGEHIRKARIAKGFSQEELAELLDITPTHVKHMESGHRKPSVELLFSAAKVLSMSVDSIIFKDTAPGSRELREFTAVFSSLTEKQLLLAKKLLLVVSSAEL